jgi:nucleoside-diphosphate-sugar epimerase
MNRTLLIAGVGYLGSEVQRQAENSGWEVIGITKSGGDNQLACDLSSLDAVTTLAKSLDVQPTAIVHCASSGRGGADAYKTVFVHGCAHLQKAFPATPLLFVSSSSVYGQTDGSTITEDAPTQPDRETSQLLLTAEKSVLTEGGCVARLAGIYGPGRSIILQRLLAGTAGIEDDGSRILNQIHRNDAASAILHLLSTTPFPAGEIFNVADSTPLRQVDCYRSLADQFNKPLPPTVQRNMNRKRAWTNKRVSNAKLCRTGWSPAFPDFRQAAPAVAETLGKR